MAALLLVLLACSLGVSSAAVAEQGFEANDLASGEALKGLFSRWRSEHGKPDLTAEEFRHRFYVFSENVRKIHTHNSKNDVTFSMALNKFADLTPAEFKAKHYGLNLGLKQRIVKKPVEPNFSHVTKKPPKSIDWRKLGAVTPVKDQGFCGSCWAFSTTGAIEGINKIATGKLVSVSEQELVDCDTERDHGCYGGLMDFAFEFVIKNGGLDTEEDYAYNATDNVCVVGKLNKKVVTIDDYEDVPENNELALLKAVSAQPVSVAIEADEESFQFYSKGIITKECGTDLDHGVLAVGYGRELGVPYWIVKNSWSVGWGEAGYVRIKRNHPSAEGLCGINMMASYPIILQSQDQKSGLSSL